MAFQRVRDILDRAKQFHRDLSAFYSRCGDQSTAEKTRILLNYMSRHEQNMVECLAGYENEAAMRVLDTWFKYPPAMATCKCFDCIHLTPAMPFQEILDAARKVDRCLLKLYRETADKSVSQEVRDLFTRLLELEKKEETKSQREALMFEREL